MDAPRSLYVHIPYCHRKCPYCAFTSYAGRDDDEVQAYVDALLLELASVEPGRDLETVYIGGGTPTALPPAQLKRVLGAIRNLGKPREWTMEANPGSVLPGHLEVLGAAGVNRVSMGVQSMRPEGLKQMGRSHTAADVEDTVAALRDHGVSNVNLDLIYGQPGQGIGEFMDDVERVLSLNPDHLSLYALQFEEGTPFTRARDAGRMDEASEELVMGQFRAASERLARAGFRLYEISNFARPGRESLHNVNYWRNLPYFGVGAGAWACVGGYRMFNEEDPVAYTRRMNTDGEARVSSERLGNFETYVETLAAGLRTAEGVDLEVLKTRTGLDARALHGDHLESMRDAGFAKEEGGRLTLTMQGMWLLDSIMEPFTHQRSMNART